MENIIGFYIGTAVKIIVVIYVLRRLWRYITNHKLRIWKLLTPEARPDKQKAAEMTPQEITTDDSDVIGSTHKVFIDYVPKKRIPHQARKKNKMKRKVSQHPKSPPAYLWNMPHPKLSRTLQRMM